MRSEKINEFLESKYRSGYSTPTRTLTTDSKLGRSPTSIKRAIEEFYLSPASYDPLKFIRKEKSFLGLSHARVEPLGLDRLEPVWIDDSDYNHMLYIHATGGGKGVFIGMKVAEAIAKGQSVIIIDPKGDLHLPLVVKKQMEAVGHADKITFVDWPRLFCLDLLDADAPELSDRLATMLGLEDSFDPAVAYYRRTARATLRKVIALMKSGKFGDYTTLSLPEISAFMRAVRFDILAEEAYQKELSKAKPNPTVLLRSAKRHFDPTEFGKIYWDTDAPRTLNDLELALSEIAEAGNFSRKLNLDEILYTDEPRVIYFRFPALSLSGAKLVKLLLAALIQKVLVRPALHETLVVCDEASLYANQNLATALALLRSGNLRFLILAQDLAQFGDPQIKNPILSNCTLKLFGKLSTKEDLEYLELIGGKEYVTGFGRMGGSDTLRQQTEPYLNITRLRAYPKERVMSVIAEAWPTAITVSSSPVFVDGKYDWSKIESIAISGEIPYIKPKYMLDIEIDGGIATEKGYEDDV